MLIYVRKLFFNDYVGSYLLVKRRREVERINEQNGGHGLEVEWGWFTKFIAKTCFKMKEFWNT